MDYVEKLKDEYTKLHSGHKIKFQELKESLEELTTDMDEDSNVRGQILGFLDQNTNYLELINGEDQEMNLVMQTELNSGGRQSQRKY